MAWIRKDIKDHLVPTPCPGPKRSLEGSLPKHRQRKLSHLGATGSAAQGHSWSASARG